MVFTFFKKPPQKMVAKPAAAPRPAEEALAVPTTLATDVRPAAAPPPAVAVVQDFSDFPFSEGPLDFHVDGDADPDPVDADAEQAAVLYANGQDETARALLEHAVRVHRCGPGERLWLMLFDLYRLSGESAAFEALEIDFAVAFEKSPPVWSDRSAGGAVSRSPVAGCVLFSGALSGGNDAGFAAVRQALAQNPCLQLDLSAVSALDASGCQRLLAELQQARKAGREIRLVGRRPLGALLESRIAPGAAAEAGCWLLLLELYQRQGRQEAFEALAIRYAVTFEVSPPSWEAARPAAGGPPPALAAPTVNDDATAGCYVARGEIKASRFVDLPAFAERHDQLLIDCTGITRIDFISAGALLNVLGTVRRSGKQVVFLHPNHLVAELFAVVGLTAVAAIVLAKN